MDVTVPMVGKIVNVVVQTGDRVKENDPVATLEAMKMEMPVVAPTTGVIKQINVKAGDEVTADTILMVIG